MSATSCPSPLPKLPRRLSGISTIPAPPPTTTAPPAAAGGDTGVQNVASVTMSAANTGTFALCLARSLAQITLSVAGLMTEKDLLNQIPSLPEIKDGACLVWLYGAGAAIAASTTFVGGLEFSTADHHGALSQRSLPHPFSRPAFRPRAGLEVAARTRSDRLNQFANAGCLKTASTPDGYGTQALVPPLIAGSMRRTKRRSPPSAGRPICFPGRRCPAALPAPSSVRATCRRSSDFGSGIVVRLSGAQADLMSTMALTGAGRRSRSPGRAISR